MSRPMIIAPIETFSATVSKQIDFLYSGGPQAISSHLIVERVSNNAIVYNATISTFNLFHIIPANSLINGVEYRARIRVGGANNFWTDFSDWVVFKALSPATVVVTNIDTQNGDRVYNQSILFTALYTQPEQEPLNSYRFLLYGSRRNLIQAYTDQFPGLQSSPPLTLTQQIDNLENNQVYFLEVLTLSISGAKSTSGLVRFVPYYLAPKIHTTIVPLNVKEEGSISLSANILQLVGKVYGPDGALVSNVEFINNEFLDLTRIDYNRAVFEEGFSINQSDFVLKFWVKNMVIGETLLTLTTPDNGSVDVICASNRIIVEKYYQSKSLLARYATPVLTIRNNVIYMIGVMQRHQMIDVVIVEEVS